MTKKEMLELIIGKLGAILPDSDYRKGGLCDFVRKIPGGRQKLGVPFWDYNPLYKFSLNICVRLDVVEDILHRFSGSPAKYHSLSSTTVTPLRYFIKDSDRYSDEFKVGSIDDVNSVFETLDVVIRDKILPFLNSHVDIESLERGVNARHPSIDITQNPPGAMHSVILAHLVKNPSIDDLIGRHRSVMQLTPEADHPFNALVRYLRKDAK